MRMILGIALAALMCTQGVLPLQTADPAQARDLAPGQIHAYPSDHPHPTGKPHQLAFQLPSDGIARAEFRSEPFYAIILKSGPRCGFTEAERQDIQALFPQNQVFMDHFACDEPQEDAIQYTNVNPDYAFIAVFGGLTHNDAETLADEMNLTTRFPGANIRKMQAVLVFP